MPPGCHVLFFVCVTCVWGYIGDSAWCLNFARMCNCYFSSMCNCVWLQSNPFDCILSSVPQKMRKMDMVILWIAGKNKEPCAQRPPPFGTQIYWFFFKYIYSGFWILLILHIERFTLSIKNRQNSIDSDCINLLPVILDYILHLL